MTEEVADQAIPPTKSPSRRLLVAILLILIAITAGLYLYNRSVSAPVATALNEETGAETPVYRRNYISNSDIVFDVKSTSGQIAMVDIFRRLLKAAESLKENEYRRVYLSSKGKEKFYLEGAYFKKLGEEREFQNPVYTIRTFPENVYRLDGTRAFGSWEGGFIGVMGQQMNDANDLQRQWWVDDAIADIQS